MDSYIEKHVTFGVDEFEDLWKLQFLHPFFFADTRRVVTVYIIPPNSDFTGSEYKGIEVVSAGPHILELIGKLLPMIQNYPYRWELDGRKLNAFGYDLVSTMTKTSDTVGSIDFTDIAFTEINRYYDFAEAIPLPEVVAEGEKVVRDAAMVKMDVVLEKAQWTNQVSFNLFTSYPIEIVSLIYQEDTMKYSKAYEIPLTNLEAIVVPTGGTLSVSSVSVLFPSVFAKKFTIILAQHTYTISNTVSSQVILAASKLGTTEPNANVVDTKLLIENLAGYLGENYDIIWGEETVAHESSKIENRALTESALSSAQSEWRPEYTAARKVAEDEMETYQQKLVEYQEAESKYKKDMEEYVRYQQQLADWNRKWG